MVNKKIRMYICMVGIAATIFIGKAAYAVGITDGQVVSANKAWKITFSHSIALDDLTKQGIVVQDSKGDNVSISIAIGSDDKSILINPPEGGYKSGENYTLILNNKVHNNKGEKLKDTKSMHFSIQKSVEASTALHRIYSSNYKAGLIDSSGKLVVQPKYNYIKLSNNNDYSINADDNNPIIVSLGSKYGLIDKAGNIILEPKYDYIYGFSDGLSRAKINNKIVFIDVNGKVVIEPQFKEAGDFNNGLAAVKGDNDKYGFIDKTGKVVIQPQFDAYTEGGGGEGFQFQYNFNGDYAAVVKDGKFGVIDKLGNYKIKLDSNFKMFVSDSLILVGQGENGYKYIDVDGNTVFSNSDMPVSSAMEAQDLFFENGFASYFKKKSGASYSMGIVDEKGKVISDAKYDYFAPRISEGMAILRANNEYVCLDTATGNEFSVDAEYVGEFKEGLARVYVKGEGNSYYIDKTGKKVLQPDSSFDSIGDFENGLAMVTYKGKDAYIDKTGKIVWQE
ncbi:WG repeat-containing protein [Clostridium neuense]|uniref:WG repeat-containing protein n=1 Tax=Clostridium neuense TaxID=1728934 RepID=A0ABW8TIW9_9CLOT